jgi:putative peptide maturation dehydrogenase
VLGRLELERWTPVEDLADDAETAQHLAELGLAVADDDTGLLKHLRLRDEQLTNEQWDRYAAAFHFMRRRRPGITVTLADADRFAPDIPRVLEEVVAEYGPPPPEFHERHAQGSIELPIDGRRGDLYDALLARRTTRGFDDAPLEVDDVSTLLRYTFGCHGLWTYTPTLAGLRKTAPSGGGWHSVEAYPLVLDVEGIASGAYHYDVRSHALSLLAPVDVAQLRARLVPALCGQDYAVSAGMVVVLSVRFFRTFWKYRQDARAYAALLLDAGHLGQTFQLVAADLGLGSLFTAAFDGPSLDAIIDVDGVEESALAVVCAGRAAPRRTPIDPDPEPFVPLRQR